MSDFGQRLRELRLARGWRQVDACKQLGGVIARSTLANVEAGRERPTPRLWEAIRTRQPDWVSSLERPYELARQGEWDAPPSSSRGAPSSVQADEPMLGGPFVVERLDIIYVFQHSRAPSEIVEFRRVRATKSGANSYGLSLRHNEGPRFTLDETVLWGGSIVESRHDHFSDRTLYWRRVDFGRSLHRGERHEFAVRSWIETDPQPDTAVCFDFTIPVDKAAIHLHFQGPEPPSEVWSYGPLHDVKQIPKSADAGVPLVLTEASAASAVFTPQSGPIYGVAWCWPD